MTATFEKPAGSGSGAPEADPVASAALAAHIADSPAHGGDVAGTPRPPTAHGHPTGDITGLDAALAIKANSADVATDAELAAAITAHEADITAVHGIADTTALILNGDARLTDARPPTAHTHPQSDVTGLVAALAAKSDIGHIHDDRYYTETESDARFAPIGGGGGGAAESSALGRIWRVPTASGKAGRLSGTQGAQAQSNNEIRVVPVYLPAPVDQIGITTSVVGEAGSLLKIVVYAYGADGYPGALLLLGAALDGATGVNSFRALDLTAAPLAAGRYYVGVNSYNAPTTRPTLRTLTSETDQLLEDTSAILSSLRVSWATTNAAYAGTPPDPFVAGAGSSAQGPLIGWRYA